MIGLVVTGHGHFASGLQEAVRVIAGDQENIEYVDFELQDSTDTLSWKLLDAFEQLNGCDGILVLADLAGGSPFKTAVMNGYARGIQCVAGTNLGMLLELLPIRQNETEAANLAGLALDAGKNSIAWFQYQK